MDCYKLEACFQHQHVSPGLHIDIGVTSMIDGALYEHFEHGGLTHVYSVTVPLKLFCG